MIIKQVFEQVSIKRSDANKPYKYLIKVLEVLPLFSLVLVCGTGDPSLQFSTPKVV